MSGISGSIRFGGSPVEPGLIQIMTTATAQFSFVVQKFG
jgi:hypothetical protein